MHIFIDRTQSNFHVPFVLSFWLTSWKVKTFWYWQFTRQEALPHNHSADMSRLSGMSHVLQGQCSLPSVTRCKKRLVSREPWPNPWKSRSCFDQTPRLQSTERKWHCGDLIICTCYNWLWLDIIPLDIIPSWHNPLRQNALSQNPFQTKSP